jgi:hypothetical protein
MQKIYFVYICHSSSHMAYPGYELIPDKVGDVSKDLL